MANGSILLVHVEFFNIPFGRFTKEITRLVCTYSLELNDSIP
jgi:hypothetical protein